MRPIPERGTFTGEPLAYGTSVLGHRLEFWPAAEQPDILIVGGVHGEEPDTSVLLSRALRSLPGQARRAAVVVAANPDGVARGTRGNARGVDLNRNFPAADWQPHPVTHCWSLEHPSEVRLGTGSGPASEPEIAALVALIGSLRPRQIVSLHGHLTCVEDPLATAFGRWVAARARLPLVPTVGYATPGSMGTWAAEARIPIITWELPPESIERLFATQLPVLTDILRGEMPADLLP
ncbi:MAG: murein tripeptide amidase MpaA [Verrucomicrobiales bacterium]